MSTSYTQGQSPARRAWHPQTPLYPVHSYQFLPILDLQRCVPEGFCVQYYNNAQLAGAPVRTEEGTATAEWLSLGLRS